MMVITGAFDFTEVLPIKQIGLAIFIAILIDGTLIPLLLVPSFMKMMGKWNWWFPSNKRTKGLGLDQKS
jgi:putative drug exporter of the RND superfamily